MAIDPLATIDHLADANARLWTRVRELEAERDGEWTREELEAELAEEQAFLTLDVAGRQSW